MDPEFTDLNNKLKWLRSHDIEYSLTLFLKSNDIVYSIVYYPVYSLVYYIVYYPVYSLVYSLVKRLLHNKVKDNKVWISLRASCKSWIRHFKDGNPKKHWNELCLFIHRGNRIIPGCALCFTLIWMWLSLLKDDVWLRWTDCKLKGGVGGPLDYHAKKSWGWW